jgi:excisionase family DNA binding protein
MTQLDPEPYAHTIASAVKVTTCGRSTIYQAIRDGELEARKCGRRTLILDSELRRWLGSLPRSSNTRFRQAER